MGFPYEEPTLIKGGCAADDRGALSFVNDFGFTGVKRFYVIENFTKGFVRAWHGHKLEGKYMVALHGSFVVGAVKVDDFERPNPDLKPHRVVISDRTPSVFAVPPGCANGLMSLTEGAKLLIFSTTSLAESQGDDYRFPARHWNIWGVEER